MEFFNKIHCRYTGIKGFITVYNDALRYRYMITTKAHQKARVLVFWEKYGLEAAMDAFKVKRRTLFYWKSQWEKGNKKIEAKLAALLGESRTQQKSFLFLFRRKNPVCAKSEMQRKLFCGVASVSERWRCGTSVSFPPSPFELWRVGKIGSGLVI